jgi:DNA processing protein
VTTIPLSADGQAIALACSGLALQGDRSLKPLSSREWHELSGVVQRSEWARPRELLGRGPDELRAQLGLAPELAQRLARLLARGGQLAFELDRLASRGIWVLTRGDDAYPARLKKLLLAQAPPVLYGAGRPAPLTERALAVVGSRDAPPGALEFAHALGRRCARQRVAVLSGAARGVDQGAMLGAIEGGGTAIGVTVDPLERLVRRRELRAPLTEGTLTLVTPFHPSARWHAGNAMRRNRLIYAMSHAAVVVATAAGSGGTWTGAIENMERGWVPLHVRADGTPGTDELIRRGGLRLDPAGPEDFDVAALLDARVATLLNDAAAPPDAKGRASPEFGAERPPDSGSAWVPAPEADASQSGSRDAFHMAWPLLRDYLQEPRTERDVAEALRLQPGQARAWLVRAVEEELAEVKAGRRKLYVSRGADGGQLSLG